MSESERPNHYRQIEATDERLPQGWSAHYYDEAVPDPYWEAHAPNHGQTGLAVHASSSSELIERVWALHRVIQIAADSVEKYPPQLPIGGVDWEGRAGLLWMALQVPPPASRQPASIFVGSEGEARPFYDNATLSPGEAFLCRVVAGPVDSVVPTRALPTTPPPPPAPAPTPPAKSAVVVATPAEAISPTELGPPTGKQRSLIEEAKQKGYTGNPCGSCGSWSMVRNGSCAKCIDCGSTDGCS